MNEKDLRAWVRAVFGRDVSWLEPASGSTVGYPDAQLHIYRNLYPVELKWAKEKKGRLVLSLRPAQIRYHIMASKQGIKTAILYGLDKGETCSIELISGKWCQKLEPRWLVANGLSDVTEGRLRLVNLLASEEFWK